jgi:DNA-binding CsgD family transcriptional regulator
MSKSTYLRVEDCRDLGDDRSIWRLHCIERLAGLVDADVGSCGESVAGGARGFEDVGAIHWGYQNWSTQAVLEELFRRVPTDPKLYTAIFHYFESLKRQDGICHSRRQLIDDREWYKSTDYQLVHRTFGMDHSLWCFRSAPCPDGNEFCGVMLYRPIGQRDFSARDRLIVHEVQAALAPLVGGPLARFNEPSPMDLAPRARQVLGCLLEGDGDKQIAARLKLSKFTVNQYTKQIFRHFGVNSRPELLARWIRRGWAGRFHWVP